MNDNKTPHKKSANQQVDYQYARVQPQALDIERAVLGALMIDKDAYTIISNILKTTDFYEPRNQRVFEAISDLYHAEDGQKPIDVLTVTDRLEKNGTLEEIGGPAYVAELSSRIASSANIEYHANIIAQKALARELIKFGSMVVDKAFDETTIIDDLMQEAEEDLFRLSKEHIKKDVKELDPAVTDAMKEITAASSNSDGITGISTGYDELDRYTSGWQNTDLNIIAGRPSMGKTAFALCIAKNIAIDQEIPLAFFSLEMSSTQLAKRLISNECQVEGAKLRNGQLDLTDWERIDKRLHRLLGKKFYLDDTPGLSVYELRSKARRLVKEHGVKVIIIDYLQLMSANTTRYSSRQDEVALVSRSLKGLAKELDIPIIALSQLNRGVENREGLEGKRPVLSDLRESGAIEQDADMVIFVHRPEYYHINEDDKGRDLRGAAEIIIAKQRNGATGDILLSFDSEHTRFTEYEKGSSLRPTQKKELDY